MLLALCSTFEKVKQKAGDTIHEGDVLAVLLKEDLGVLVPESIGPDGEVVPEHLKFHKIRMHTPSEEEETDFQIVEWEDDVIEARMVEEGRHVLDSPYAKHDNKGNRTQLSTKYADNSGLPANERADIKNRKKRVEKRYSKDIIKTRGQGNGNNGNGNNGNGNNGNGNGNNRGGGNG